MKNRRGAIAVSKNPKTSIKLILIIQGFLIGTSGLFVQNVFANPVQVSAINLRRKIG